MHIEILRRAKKYLRITGCTEAQETEKIYKSAYVCTAISSAAHESPLFKEPAGELRDWIESQLQAKISRISTLGQWLATMHPKIYMELSEKNNIQHYRLAWIDHMISILSAPD